MFSSQSADVSLDAPCRAISSVRADKVDSRFLAGSCCTHSQAADPTTSGSSVSVNHLYLVRFHSEVNELGIDARIPHDTGPVSKIVCSPTDPSLVVTTTTDAVTGGSSCSSEGAAATLWKIPRSIIDQHERSYHEDDNEDASASSASQATSMEALAALKCESRDITDVVWGDGSSFLDAASTTGGEVVTLERNGMLTQWDVSLGKAESARHISATRGSRKPSSRCVFPPRVALDPHASSVGDAAAVSVGSSIYLVDWRTDASIPTGTVDKFCAHPSVVVTGLDYNPNKPYVLATSGQDGLIKFFDLRSAKRPILVGRGGHSHWVWNVQYNPFHDQLVLSTGTDSIVNLWRVSTISSAPLLTLDDDFGDNDDPYGGGGGGPDEMGGSGANRGGGRYGGGATTSFSSSGPYDPDGPTSLESSSAPNLRVTRYDHGGDPVYASAWGSAADAWIYATVSYDGTVALNHVPSKEKYKILL